MPDPMKRTYTLPAVLGIIAVVISIITLLTTYQYNRGQSRIVACSVLISRDVAAALQRRDAATTDLQRINRDAVEARRVVILLLAKSPMAPDISLTEALRRYEEVIPTYELKLDQYVDSLRSAPALDTSCLTR